VPPRAGGHGTGISGSGIRDGRADRPQDVGALGHESQPIGHRETARVVRARGPGRDVTTGTDVGRDGRGAGPRKSLPAMPGVGDNADVLETVADEERHRDGDRAAVMEGRPRRPGRGQPGRSAPGVADPADPGVEPLYRRGVPRGQSATRRSAGGAGTEVSRTAITRSHVVGCGSTLRNSASQTGGAPTNPVSPSSAPTRDGPGGGRPGRPSSRGPADRRQPNRVRHHSDGHRHADGRAHPSRRDRGDRAGPRPVLRRRPARQSACGHRFRDRHGRGAAGCPSGGPGQLLRQPAHTARYPAGAVRGQLHVVGPPIDLDAVLRDGPLAALLSGTRRCRPRVIRTGTPPLRPPPHFCGQRVTPAVTAATRAGRDARPGSRPAATAPNTSTAAATINAGRRPAR